MTNVYKFVRRTAQTSRTRCRSGAAKAAANTVLRTSSSDGIEKQAARPAAFGVAAQNQHRPKSVTEQPQTASADGRNVFAQLVGLGVSECRARNLVSEFEAERILRQIAWLRHRRARNPGAMLATAIAQDWDEPAAARIERAQFTRAEASVQAEAARLEHVAREKAARESEDRDLTLAIATLPAAVVAASRAAALQAVETYFPRFLARTGAGPDRVPRSGVRVTLDAGRFSARNDG
ncbi:MAG: hypothetical protein IAI49_14250 [Candidatus Eremiobacteraeota bacterium]|nr:hypothetical protein [Candidatus Eremiobacteraeota bacterium]